MMKRIFNIFLFVMLAQISFLTQNVHPQFSGEASGIEGFLSFKDGRRLSWKGESSKSLFQTGMTYLTKPLVKLYDPQRKLPVQISAAKMTIGHYDRGDRVIILRENVVIKNGSQQLKTSFVKLNPETFFMTSYADYSIRNAQKVSQGRGFYGSPSRLFLLKVKEKRSPADDQGRIQTWIDILSDKSVYIDSRCSVAEALAESDDIRVIQPLINALNESDPTLVAIAAKGLGRMKATAAIHPLIKYLAYLHVTFKGSIFARDRRDDIDFSQDYVTDNPDLHAALSIAWALGRIGTRATEALIGYLDAPGEDLKTGAAWALGRISSPLNLILLLYPRAQAKEIEEATFETPNLKLALPRLRKLVQSKEATMPLRATAARALGRIKDKEAIPALFEAVTKSFDEDLLINIIWALGEIGNDEAISLLCEFLKRTDEEIDLSDDLISLEHISNTLIKIGTPSVPFLLKVLSEPEFDKENRKLGVDEQRRKEAGAKAAIEALGEIRDRRAIDTLSNVVFYNRHTYWDLNENALRALLKFDDLPLRSLRIVAACGLYNKDIFEHFSSPIYVKKMIEILKTRDEELIRLEKLYEDIVKMGIGDRGKPDQYLQLEQELDFDSKSFAMRIIEALGPLADNAVDALIAVVKSESSEETRVEAIRALSAIGNPKALPALIEALKDNENWLVRGQIRKSAFEVLSRLMPTFKETKERFLPTPDDKISSLHDFKTPLEDRYVEGLLSFLNDYQTRINNGHNPNLDIYMSILQELARIQKTQAFPLLFNSWLGIVERVFPHLTIHDLANFNDRFVETLVMIGEDSLEHLLNQMVLSSRQYDTDRVSHLIGLFQKLWIHFPEQFLLAVQKEPLSEFESQLLSIIHKSGKTAVAPLLEVLVKESAPEAKVLAINMLREIRDKAAILPIAMLLTDQNKAIRQAAKDYFLNMAFNDTEIRYLLHIIIYSTEEKERDAATKVFMELKDSHSAVELMDILESRLKHSTERGKKALEPILEALKERR